MISFFVGVPGSGKTYFAVDKIYNNFSSDKEAIRDKKATYEICYTNINEFNFDKVDNVHYLNFDDFKIKLTELHKYYKEKKDDDFLIEKCKEYNILNALFVIDEAHNYFDYKDVVLIWWLSYHRHLYHEIILITQNLSLIESKYKSFSEFFYKAFPQSLTLFKTHFKYNIYCSSRMSQISKSGSIKIKRNKKVFELYKSGDSVSSDNIVLKILMSAFALLLLLVIVFYFYSESLKSNSDDISPLIANNIVIDSLPAVQNNIISSSDYDFLKFITFSCNSSSCYNQNISIPVPLVNYFIKNNNLTLLYTNEINSNYIKLYLSCSENFYKFLTLNQGVKQNEEKSISNGFFNHVPASQSQSR